MEDWRVRWCFTLVLLQTLLTLLKTLDDWQQVGECFAASCLGSDSQVGARQNGRYGIALYATVHGRIL